MAMRTQAGSFSVSANQLTVPHHERLGTPDLPGVILPNGFPLQQARVAGRGIASRRNNGFRIRCTDRVRDLALPRLRPRRILARRGARRFRSAGAGERLPSVCVVIPARNEAEGVGQCVGSLLRQDYRGLKSVVLVDDESTDGTADVARRAAAACGAADRLAIVPGTPLPKGWTGKLWAMRQGIAAAMASETPPDYLLLTDADIVYAAACDELARRPRLRQGPRARLVHGVPPLRDGGGTRAHSGLHLFLPDVVSVRAGQPAGRCDGRRRRRMHAGAGRRAATGGRDRCDPQRPDRRLRARRPSQGQGADLARPDLAGAQPARISPLVGRRPHGVADGLCAATLFAADARGNRCRPHARLSRAAGRRAVRRRI